MMTKILLLTTALTFSSVYAQTESGTDNEVEEAAILNQEMRFLQDSAKASSVTTLQGSKLPVRTRNLEESTLEQRYFGEEDDSISTRTAAPKRKRSF